MVILLNISKHHHEKRSIRAGLNRQIFGLRENLSSSWFFMIVCTASQNDHTIFYSDVNMRVRRMNFFFIFSQYNAW